jgi:2-dehydro-3-deoxygluconokinase
MPDLLCMGEPMLELNQRRRQPNAEGGEILYLQGHGGDTSNAAIAAARNGASVGYISAIGRDAPGDSLVELWAREGVDASTVARDETAPTGLYVVSHGEDGHRFTYYRAGSAASRVAPAEVPEAAIRGARMLHVSGVSQAISASACDAVFRAIEVAKAAGVGVSYDTNLRLSLWPKARAAAVIHAGVAQADVALPSFDDVRVLTGLEEPDAIADFYLRLGCPLVLLKMGSKGVIVATPERRERVGAFRVEAVDATGAGDTFAGSFLARHLAGDDPFAAARYANAAAALSTTGYGAVAPIPRPDAVNALLREQG